jgi:hypothetical protein
MSKSANAGELRTAVIFKRIIRGTNSNGFPVEAEESIFTDGGIESGSAGFTNTGNTGLQPGAARMGGSDIPVMCKWQNAHGNEVFSAMQLQLRDPATITTRYSPLLDDVTLICYRAGDSEPYEVISIDNVEQRNTWLEIKVRRREAAR